LFEKSMALRGKATVTGKFRRRDRGANVIKFISRREGAIEANADHDSLKGFRPINKSKSPTGKETPFVVMMILLGFKKLSKVLSNGADFNSRTEIHTRFFSLS